MNIPTADPCGTPKPSVKKISPHKCPHCRERDSNRFEPFDTKAAAGVLKPLKEPLLFMKQILSDVAFLDSQNRLELHGLPQWLKSK